MSQVTEGLETGPTRRGTVSDYCSAHARCPVVVVPAGEPSS
jgi:hypothetical protein